MTTTADTRRPTARIKRGQALHLRLGRGAAPRATRRCATCSAARAPGLAEMTIAGLPTPPGFTITTEACNDYFAAGERLPDGLWDDVLEAVKEVERRTGKGFGEPANPLLVSVRSGAKFSMPGMMDTVLNLGLNEQTLQGMIALTGQRAVRLGRLPALHPDVRADRDGGQRRALRPRARGVEDAGTERRRTPTSTPRP